MSRTILTFVDDLSEDLAPFAAALVDFLQSCQQAGAVVADSTFSGGFPNLSRQWSKQVEIIHRGLGQGSDGSRYVGLPTHRLEDLSGKSPKQSLICWPHGVRREGAPNSSRGGAALPSYPGCLLPIESSTSRWESRVSEIHARICPAAVCGAVPSTLWSARHTVLPPR